MITDEISTYVIIKEEICDADDESNLKPRTPKIAEKDIFIEIKIEAVENEDGMKPMDLYEDHEVKEEVVVGPVVLRKPGPINGYGHDHVRDTQPNTLSEQKFSCEMCKKSFTNKSNLLEHMLTHEIKFSCYLCNEKFQRKSLFESHMLIHSQEKKLSCTVCKKNYLYKKNLLWHLINRHSRASTLSCKICDDKKFSQKHKLETHMSTHSEETFSCDLCKENYVYKSGLRIHLRKHIGGLSFTCKFCKKECETQSALVCHERMHTREKPFPCDICGASFSRSSPLHRHMRWHSGQKPLKCEFCEKKFVRLVDLQRHVSTHA